MSYKPVDASTTKPYRETAPMPSSVPHVDEIGTTSAPLKSAAFFIGEYCKDYNEDFMLCKNEDRNPAHCLKEGRRVTRCAQALISKMRENCAETWDKHWQCLEMNNQNYYRCRTQEKSLNECVFDKLGIKKVIPGAPPNQPQIHEKKNPVYTGVQK